MIDARLVNKIIKNLRAGRCHYRPEIPQYLQFLLLWKYSLAASRLTQSRLLNCLFYVPAQGAFPSFLYPYKFTIKFPGLTKITNFRTSCLSLSILSYQAPLLDLYDLGNKALISRSLLFQNAFNIVFNGYASSSTPSKKVIQGRAGAINIIPTSTGSDVATVQVLPDLQDRLRVTALRVPVVDGSITDINAVLKSKVTEQEVNARLRVASGTSLAGILQYSEEELVSTDIIGNVHSAIIHAKSTRVVRDTHVKVQAWYDNEYGYACRLLEAASLIGAD